MGDVGVRSGFLPSMQRSSLARLDEVDPVVEVAVAPPEPEAVLPVWPIFTYVFLNNM